MSLEAFDHAAHRSSTLSPSMNRTRARVTNITDHIQCASTFMFGDKKRCRGPHAPRDTFMSIMRRERGSRSERVICSDGGFGDREGSESSF